MAGPLPTFVAAMLLWVSQLTGLPMAEPPPIFVVTAAEGIRLHSSAEGGTIAVTTERAVYLHPSISQTGDPESDSMLVHELVHWLQIQADKQYHCDAEAERLAYAVQEVYLAFRGVDFWKVMRWRPRELAKLMECP
jgi:hypothetical protein